MKIQGGKQVGPIYYMVKDIPVLCSIVSQQVIRTSLKAEPQSKGGSKFYYVSFMRDLTKADRNPGRWVYGVQIDGDKLSDRYSINPFSYAGTATKTGFYRVKTLISYDNNTYSLSLVNWPTIEIPKIVFDELEQLIVSDSQGINDKKKLEVSTGKRPYLGKTIVTRYNYNVPSGGITLKEGLVPENVLSYLMKHTSLNETEERIWVLKDDVKFINIRGCITGYIAPKGDDSVQQAIDDGLLDPLKIFYY